MAIVVTCPKFSVNKYKRKVLIPMSKAVKVKNNDTTIDNRVMNFFEAI